MRNVVLASSMFVLLSAPAFADYYEQTARITGVEGGTSHVQLNAFNPGLGQLQNVYLSFDGTVTPWISGATVGTLPATINLVPVGHFTAPGAGSSGDVPLAPSEAFPASAYTGQGYPDYFSNSYTPDKSLYIDKNPGEKDVVDFSFSAGTQVVPNITAGYNDLTEATGTIDLTYQFNYSPLSICITDEKACEQYPEYGNPFDAVYTSGNGNYPNPLTNSPDNDNPTSGSTRVPEPMTAALLFPGLLGLGMIRFRRR